jgi:hypothetical protein
MRDRGEFNLRQFLPGVSGNTAESLIRMGKPPFEIDDHNPHEHVGEGHAKALFACANPCRALGTT